MSIMTMSSMKSPSKQSGITLIEILVAVLVLGIGLLGVAGLQSLSLNNATRVHFDQKTQSYADDLINRIMANNVAASSGDYAEAIPGAKPAPDCASETCSSEQLAAWDLWEWNSRLTNETGAPPSASASIDWVEARGEYQIAISWDGDSAGENYDEPTTCTAADNSARGCYFAIYRVR